MNTAEIHALYIIKDYIMPQNVIFDLEVRIIYCESLKF